MHFPAEKCRFLQQKCTFLQKKCGFRWARGRKLQEIAGGLQGPRIKNASQLSQDCCRRGGSILLIGPSGPLTGDLFPLLASFKNSSAIVHNEGKTHPNKPPTQIKTVCANNLCKLSPLFPFKTSRKQRKEFVQTVFIWVGGFLGGSPSLQFRNSFFFGDF